MREAAIDEGAILERSQIELAMIEADALERAIEEDSFGAVQIAEIARRNRCVAEPVARFGAREGSF